MEHIRAIQELVDEHKESMPTGVVTAVMEECQKAYQTVPKLYKLTWTTVDSHAHVERCDDDEDIAHVKLDAKTQTLIVEAVHALHMPDHPDHGAPVRMCACAMPHHGMMLTSWLKLSMPRTMCIGEDSMVIVHSIEPYEPRKRAREE